MCLSLCTLLKLKVTNQCFLGTWDEKTVPSGTVEFYKGATMRRKIAGEISWRKLVRAEKESISLLKNFMKSVSDKNSSYCASSDSSFKAWKYDSGADWPHIVWLRRIKVLRISLCDNVASSRVTNTLNMRCDVCFSSNWKRLSHVPNDSIKAKIWGFYFN